MDERRRSRLSPVITPMAILSTSGDGHRRRRRRLHAGSALHLDIAARIADIALGHELAVVAADAVLLVAHAGVVLAGAAGRAHHRRRRAGVAADNRDAIFGGGRLGGLDGNDWLGRRGPAGDLPFNAGEGLETEAAALPLAAGLTGSVEGAEAGIDGALVCFGAESVGVAAERLECTVLAVGGSQYGMDDAFVSYAYRKGSYSQALSLLGTWLSLGLGLAVGSGRRTLGALLLLRRAHDRWGGRAICTGCGWVGVRGEVFGWAGGRSGGRRGGRQLRVFDWSLLLD